MSAANIVRARRKEWTVQSPEVVLAARALDAGKLVAFPTDTVYALAAGAAIPDALDRLAEAKRRPKERPFAVLLADASDLSKYVSRVPLDAAKLIERFWPGPLTLVLPARDGTVGLRLPAHPLARAIARATKAGVAATSANLSGGREALTAHEVAAEFGGVLDVIIVGECGSIPPSHCPAGTPSSVVRVDDGGWEVLREGAVSAEEIAELIGPSG